MRNMTCLIAAIAAAIAVSGCGAGFVPAEKVELGPSGGLLVNGKPFFPLMNFYQSPESFKNAGAMGLNAYFMPGSKPPPKEYLDALQAGGLYGIVPFAEDAVGHPALLAWLLPHEPDRAYLVSSKQEMSPEKMAEAYAAIRKADRSHPVVLDFSPEFMSDVPFATALSEEQKRANYPAYAKAADIVTYNVYPVWGHNRPDKLDWVAKAADDLKSLIGPKPFFAMVETTTGWREIDPAEQKPLTADEIRSEVWMAITHGATGIVYFTHQFKPKFGEHGLDAERHAAIKAINDQITRLAPVLLSPSTLQPTMTIEGGLETSVTARLMPFMFSNFYIFAQNIDMRRRGGMATIKVPWLLPGMRIEVVDEDRTILADRGSFTDEFGPLAVHIYRVTC